MPALKLDRAEKAELFRLIDASGRGGIGARDMEAALLALVALLAHLYEESKQTECLLRERGSAACQSYW